MTERNWSSNRIGTPTVSLTFWEKKFGLRPTNSGRAKNQRIRLQVADTRGRGDIDFTTVSQTDHDQEKKGRTSKSRSKNMGKR